MPRSAQLKDLGATALTLLKTGLLRRSGIYLIATIINASIPFLLLPVLARALGPTNYGVVGSLTALVNMAVVVVGLSAHGVLTPLYFQEDRQTFANSITACFVVLAATTPCLELIILLFGPTLERLTGVTQNWQWIITASAVGQFGMAIALAVYRVQGQAVRFAAIQIGNTALNIGISVILVVGFKWGWEGRALAMLIANLGVGIAGVALLSREWDIFELPRWQNIKRAVRFGGPLVPHLLATIIRNSLDRLIIGAMVGLAQAGKYFVAFQIANILTLLCGAINQAWAPWLFRKLSGGKSEDRREIVRVTYCVLALYVAAAIGMMITGPLLMPFFIGDKFGDAGDLLIVLAPSAAFNGGYFLFTNYIFYVQKTEWLAGISIGMAFVQAAITLPFVHFFGVWGAAFATLLGGALFMGSVWAAAEHLVPMGWFAWFQRSTPRPA
jgi:O-antigen/teichoic acid export membrane protein